VQRDEPGDAPETRPDEPADKPSDWTIEDFDNFAAFENEGEPGVDDSGQGTLEFGFKAEEEPIAVAPLESKRPDAGDRQTGEGRMARDDPAHTWSPEVAPYVAEADDLDDLEDSADALEEVESEGDPAADEEGIFEDTVVAAFEGGEAAGAAPAFDSDAVEVPDFASFTSDQYMQTTTQEFVDLAEEMARSADTDHVQSAISAEIPGLDSGIIGLEDVVAAAGTDPSDIPVAQRSNLALRVSTALALAFIFFASLYAPLFIGLFVLVVLFLSTGEFYSALMRVGHRPLGLFGLLGALGALAGTWAWGLVAVPVAVVGTLVATLLFFGMVAERRNPLMSTALTVLGTVWIGGMGAFLFEMVKADDYGWLIVATIVTVAMMDMASFFFGRRVGRHRLAPHVSPKKTVEGLVGGMFVAILVGVAFGLREPFDLGSGLALGAVVAVAAPFGDLAVSAVKRSIGVKDMGTLLPGHGGLLDRIDAMLFVIPLAWIVFKWTGLLT